MRPCPKQIPPSSDIFHFHNTNIKSMAMIMFLTIIHGIADLIAMLLRRSDEVQQTGWNSETQSNISDAEVC
ncbi:hypothetical protein BKA61DRAFT_740079 [Leptodontidium sp. MPI-SDFR-AT-0119]|nr:hypothetical protein BKA61DRAFT_740079 [Leptodontidium sp. MPI-SDFR-AT-0119]